MPLVRFSKREAKLIQPFINTVVIRLKSLDNKQITVKS